MDLDLPLSVRLRIDEQCDLFERQCRQGDEPDPVAFLDNWSGREAKALLLRLLEIDRVYHQKSGRDDGIDTHARPSRRNAEVVGAEVSTTPGNAPTETGGDFGSSANQFLPGEMLAGRYRIVALLGRGGMGEVYRAEDVLLGQSVALKFLTRHHVQDQRRLQYFYNEVRLSQRLAHPHICRVHDLVEIGSLRCLSMEYIEGENLQVLIRRIGPLPEAKALELARQICQGLQAAHEVGVLHRDLKPANIMIDERGRARITDFGLAREFDQHDQSEGLVGSPAYMAPEQLAHNQTSVQTDLYSLALVLFEMWTGRTAHATHSRKELTRFHKNNSAMKALRAAAEIADPIAEAIIPNLSVDPKDRSSSAAALAAALPGRSPLSAALALGDTPSPAMVAAAGPVAGMSIGLWTALLVGILVAISCVLPLSSFSLSRLGTLRAPAALVEDAGSMLEALNCPRGKSTSWGYVADRAALRWAGKNIADAATVRARAGAYFWYRESQYPLAPLVPDWKGDAFLVVDESRPLPVQPGDVHLRLDGEGRLRYLSYLPRDSVASGAGDDVWNRLFQFSGLDAEQISLLQPIEPKFTPPSFAEERRSWLLAKQDNLPFQLRIDAARAGQSPTFFRLVGPWNDSSDLLTWSGIASDNPLLAAMLLIWIPLLIVFSAWQARRNLNAGRADRKSANRLAYFCALGVLLVWLLGGGHVFAPLEIDLFVTALAAATLLAVMVWSAYVAFEPHVRRYWPQTLFSWSRLLQGQFRDALVGRDILIGCASGAVAALGKLLIVAAPVWIGAASYGLPNIVNFTPLGGARAAAAEIGVALVLAVLYSLFFQLLFLMGLRLVLPRMWQAAVGFAAFLSLMVAVQYEPFAWAFTVTSLEMALTIFILVRVGLLAAVAMHFVRLMLKWPMATNFSLWYAETGQAALVVILILVAFASYISRPRSGPQVG